jgi:hypothetical protein
VSKTRDESVETVDEARSWDLVAEETLRQVVSRDEFLLAATVQNQKTLALPQSAIARGSMHGTSGVQQRSGTHKGCRRCLWH